MTEQENPRLMSPLALAFLGDAVYELCARRRVLAEGGPVGGMHLKTVELVNAGAQSAALEQISALLTEEELAVYKRGRNASASSTPKHAQIADYRRATGVEALFGYLFLRGEQARIEELFDRMHPAGAGEAE